MRMTVVFLLFLEAPLSALFAQEHQSPDSIRSTEQEILSHPETDLSLLGKARAVLLEAIRGGDTTKARKVLAYMDQRFDLSRVVTLYPREEILLGYWLNDYGRILSFVTAPEPDPYQNRLKLFPQPDLLGVQLREFSVAARERLVGQVKSSSLPLYKRDFLVLFFGYVTIPEDPSVEELEKIRAKLNAESDEYLLTYTDSEFNPLIRQNIRYVITTSPWGFGVEGSVGYLELPTELANRLKDYALLSLALEAAYQQAYACMRLDVGLPHHIRHGFDYNGTWKDGLLVMQTGLLIAGGPMIQLGNNFVFTPHVGIGFLDFSPPEDEKNKEGNDVSLTFAAVAVGVNLDIPLMGENGGTYLRLNIGHRMALTSLSFATGGYTFVTLGLEFFKRPEVREY